MTLGEEDIPQVIGSYQIELDTGMENVDCFFLDPPEQQLLGKRFQSKGLLICLHGMPPSTDILEEWITLAQRTGLLGLGITMAVPNVQMSSVMEAKDFRRIIGAILGQVGLKQCLLMGKGWGGPEVIKFTLEYCERLNIPPLPLLLPSGPKIDGGRFLSTGWDDEESLIQYWVGDGL